MGTNGWTASSAGEDLAKAVHHTCGGLPALPRAASPSLPARHLLRALWRLCVDSTPPELTEPVPADADGAGISLGLEPSMRCAGADLGGCQCAHGLRGGYGVAASPAAGLASAGTASGASMKHQSRLPLTATPSRRALAKLAGRGQAAAIRPQNPRGTSAAPCPRYTPHPRALAAAEDQLEGARAQLVHAEQRHEVNRQALSIRLAWACAARSAHM